MPKIDSQMLQIYEQCTKKSSDQAEKISGNEALRLISRAEELNTSSSCFSNNTHRGNKYLQRLVETYSTNFSKESQSVINNYIQTGQIPSSPSKPDSGRNDATPDRSSESSSVSLPRHHSSTSDVNPNGPSITVPNSSSSGGSISGPNTPSVGNVTGEIGPNGQVILDFQAKKKTWYCHWFPMQETKKGGDPINNLYAEGGPLAKLDMVTGGNARQYEFENNRKAMNAGNEYSWWGHCNNSAEAACILREPKYDVVRNGINGENVIFTPLDVQGLVVKVTPSLIEKVDFKGERYNGQPSDDPNDPAPEVFLDTMKNWAKDDLPFVVDLDNGQQVWNFPYDKVKISESATPPSDFVASGLPRDGSVKYYHMELSGTGYDKKRRVYACYIQRDSAGNVQTSGWIKTSNTHDSPDFLWRPHPIGDLMNKATWQYRGRPSNPAVDPGVVYDIYMQSLG
jgi:hypothetical protein